jgi:hypothetical protein
MNQKLSLYKRIVIPNAVNGARVFFSARSRREGPCAVTASPNMLGPIRVFSVIYDGVSREGTSLLVPKVLKITWASAPANCFSRYFSAQPVLHLRKKEALYLKFSNAFAS